MATILIVDDDQDCRTVLRWALKSQGHEVTEARDGEEALQRITSEKPELVLLDVLMPKKDGIETLQVLQTSKPAIPVIAMSGGGQLRSEFLLRMMGQFGAIEYLAKPFSPADLAAAVSRQLRPS